MLRFLCYADEYYAIDKHEKLSRSEDLRRKEYAYQGTSRNLNSMIKYGIFDHDNRSSFILYDPDSDMMTDVLRIQDFVQ